MARPLRIEYPGAVYHITSRGNAREAIALADDDRDDFFHVLGTVVERHSWRCYAYCLMTNHYHLLIETPTANLSRGMRQMNGLYTQRFNRRHARVGHVFQGRFASIVVDRESYLLELARYVVLNPVRAKMVRRPDSYRWSSYRATAGLEEEPSWLTTDAILQEFGSRRAAARERYRAFVSEGVGRVSPWDDLRGQVLLGSDSFVERLEPALRDKSEVAEVPRRQRLAGRPALASLLPRPSGGAGKVSRDRAIREAVLDHGYTLAAVARHLGLHYATISKIANRPQRSSRGRAPAH